MDHERFSWEAIKVKYGYSNWHYNVILCDHCHILRKFWEFLGSTWKKVNLTSEMGACKHLWSWPFLLVNHHPEINLQNSEGVKQYTVPHISSTKWWHSDI